MRCADCDAFHLVDEGNAGECRLKPPGIFLVPVQGLGFASQFPKVALDCWCSEFAEKLAPDDPVIETPGH